MNVYRQTVDRASRLHRESRAPSTDVTCRRASRFRKRRKRRADTRRYVGARASSAGCGRSLLIDDRACCATGRGSAARAKHSRVDSDVISSAPTKARWSARRRTARTGKRARSTSIHARERERARARSLLVDVPMRHPLRTICSPEAHDVRLITIRRTAEAQARTSRKQRTRERLTNDRHARTHLHTRRCPIGTRSQSLFPRTSERL